MPELGEKAPDFTLPDQDWNKKSLAELNQDGKVILSFFVGAFSGVCTKEFCAFRDSWSRLEGSGARVVGISVDLPFALKAFAQTHNLSFTLLSDYNREVIKKYGVVWPNFRNVPGWDISNRAVFLVDRGGIVRYKWVAPQPGEEPNYDEVINAAHSP